MGHNYKGHNFMGHDYMSSRPNSNDSLPCIPLVLLSIDATSCPSTKTRAGRNEHGPKKTAKKGTALWPIQLWHDSIGEMSCMPRLFILMALYSYGPCSDGRTRSGRCRAKLNSCSSAAATPQTTSCWTMQQAASSYGLCSYGLCGYGLCSYGLCSYGLCTACTMPALS